MLTFLTPYLWKATIHKQYLAQGHRAQPNCYSKMITRHILLHKPSRPFTGPYTNTSLMESFLAPSFPLTHHPKAPPLRFTVCITGAPVFTLDIPTNAPTVQGFLPNILKSFKPNPFKHPN